MSTAYRLVVEKGRSKGRFARLKPSGTFVVGRDKSNHLRISDPQTSRKHFKVDARLGEFTLTDLNSSNGTFLNGEPVKSSRIQPGDKIAIGDTLVYFLEETDEDAGNRRGQLTGREIAGYRIGRLLGRGGMGTVYEAVQISLERTVAFKVLSPELSGNREFIDRFISEARAAGRLNHANIVAVFDVGSSDGLHFYSMEYMSGGSVEDLLRREGPLKAARTIPIVFDTARGLEYAEKHGLVHRDIKPDNLMLGADDVVKICDLGLATFSSRQHDVSGSPHYIAPEQALGKDIDHRADLYALGVSWYQMLSGKTPFSGRTPQEIARKQVEEEPPPLHEAAEEEVPADVAEVVGRLMQKDPAGRPAGARQLQADLAELARRYPVRETVLLRIDAVAPEVPPSDSLLEAAPDELAGGGGLSWILLALVAIALLAGAFLVTSSIMSSSAQRLAAAQEALLSAQGLLDDGKLADAAQRAEELALSFEEQGLDEQMEQALELGRRAVTLQQQAEKEAREQTAWDAFTQARALWEQHAGAEPETPGLPERLEEILRQLNAVIEEHELTKAAQEAQVVRNTVSERLRVALSARDAQEEREREAARSLERTKQGIASLLAEDRPGKFGLALERAREYHRDFGAIEPRGGPALEEEVRQAANRAVQKHTSQALSHVTRGEWQKAREQLDKVQPPLGFPELEERVRSAEATLHDARDSAHQEQRRERQLADKRRLADALRSIETDVKERRYQAAASSLRGDALALQTEKTRRLAAARVDRLELADQATQLLADHVRAGKPGIELELSFPIAGKQRATAVEVGPKGRRFTFQHTPQILLDVDLEEMKVADLLGFFKVIELDLAGRLAVAGLACELGDVREGGRRLRELASLDPASRKRVEELQFLLADSGQ